MNMSVLVNPLLAATSELRPYGYEGPGSVVRLMLSMPANLVHPRSEYASDSVPWRSLFFPVRPHYRLR
jgi:hypothetical protein